MHYYAHYVCFCDLRGFCFYSQGCVFLSKCVSALCIVMTLRCVDWEYQAVPLIFSNLDSIQKCLNASFGLVWSWITIVIYS